MRRKKIASCILRKDSQFDTWFNNLVTYVMARILTAKPEWSHVRATEAAALAKDEARDGTPEKPGFLRSEKFAQMRL
jgi:hypothetical protein